MDSFGFSGRRENDFDQFESRQTHAFERALAPAEQKYLSKRLPKGFCLQQRSDIHKPVKKQFHLIVVSPLIQVADCDAKEKRVGQQNQYLREQPWTDHCSKTIQKLLQMDFAPASRSRAKRNTEKQHHIEFQTRLRLDLEAIRKKLARGDFIGENHFVREVKLLCLNMRTHLLASPEAVESSIRLENAFVELYENNQAIDDKLRQAIMARSKVDCRRKKPTARKGSDQFGSKQTAETDNRVSRTLDRLRVEAELSRKFSNLRGEDLENVWRILVKHDEGLANCNRDDRVEIVLENLSDAALSELSEYARSLVCHPKSKPKPKKPPQKAGVSQATPVESADSINSSFLTGSLSSPRLRPRLRSRD